MATIYIDGKPYDANPGENLLATCLNLGMDLPYFCWHPAMGSVGACRQCAVKQYKDENDTRGRITMACMTAAADGTRITVNDDDSRAFRAAVIEWLMANHPHDCPVCEEGGECHLQDMTVMTGHTYRRYRLKKRTFRNQDLGPFINHEMNRCITCYRCVRFYQDYAGGTDLQAFASKNHVYFGRHQDGALDNEFSGNLVEVCPTGVFTDKTLSARYARKWDLQSAPSVCHHCGLGCNIFGNERYGELRRILNRYNRQVNGYFICDRGRFGYAFVNSDRRIRQAALRDAKDGRAAPATPRQALQRAAAALADRHRVIGIGSPRASLESNFALRELVGAERFYAGVSPQEHQIVDLIRDILFTGPARSAAQYDAEQADAVLVLGEDLTNAAPRLALTLRQSIRQKSWEIAERLHVHHWNDHVVRNAAHYEKSPLFIATPMATGLDDAATTSLRAAPADLARLGFAIAHALDAKSPGVKGLRKETLQLARTIATALQRAKRPLVVAGTGCHSEAVIQAAANIAWALDDAQLCYTVPECNSLGLALIQAGGLDGALETVQEGRADTIIMLENDLYGRAERAAVDALFAKAARVITIDHVENATTERADVVLPAATFAEADGTLVNNEGRAQRFFQVFMPDGDIRESWRWLGELAEMAGGGATRWHNLDEVIQACEKAIPAVTGITRAAPLSDFRITGLRVNRQPHRYSGRTAMHANVSVHEPRPPDDPDAPMSFSMEGYSAQPPPALSPFYWAPGWDSEQALNKFQSEVGGPLRGGDPGVRLIEPPAERQPDFFTGVPEAFVPRVGEWLVVPLYHIFGSEALSVLSPAVAERAPSPYLAMHPEDARGLATHKPVEFAVGNTLYSLPVVLRADLPPGVAGLPLGLAGVPFVTLPAWGHITRRSP